jgi:hypothetical protein
MQSQSSQFNCKKVIFHAHVTVSCQNNSQGRSEVNKLQLTVTDLIWPSVNGFDFLKHISQSCEFCFTVYEIL